MPEYSISVKIQELVDVASQKSLADAGEGKLLMEQGLQRELGSKGSKDPKLGKNVGYSAPHLTGSADAGSCMTRFPKQTGIQPAALQA